MFKKPLSHAWAWSGRLGFDEAGVDGLVARDGPSMVQRQSAVQAAALRVESGLPRKGLVFRGACALGLGAASGGNARSPSHVPQYIHISPLGCESWFVHLRISPDCFEL